MHYLYKITNQLNNKVYIGQTNNKYRWRQHRYYSKFPEKTKQYIHYTIKKYGIDNFTYEIIAQSLTQEGANETETILISQYNSCNKEYGYNIMPGGSNISGKDHPNYGKKVSLETKMKMSISAKGKNTWTKGKSSSKQGTKLSPEQKMKISQTLTGKVQSKETIEKRINKIKNNKINGKKRKPYSNETIRKMSEAAKNRKKKI